MIEKPAPSPSAPSSLNIIPGTQEPKWGGGGAGSLWVEHRFQIDELDDVFQHIRNEHFMMRDAYASQDVVRYDAACTALGIHLRAAERLRRGIANGLEKRAEGV